MTPSYANALVQRYMRSSVIGQDTSGEQSSSSQQSAGAAVRASRASVKAVASAAKHVPESSSIELRSSTAKMTQQRPLKRDSSVAKRASSLIRAADSSSDGEHVQATRGRRHSSPSFGMMPPQQQSRAPSAAIREPSRSAAGRQSISHRRNSHTNEQRDQQQLGPRRDSSPPQLYNSAGGVRLNCSSQEPATALPRVSDAGRALAGIEQQSIVDTRAEQLVASYYPDRIMFPPSRGAFPQGRVSQTLPAGHRSSFGATLQGRQPARSLVYDGTEGFVFPNLTPSNEGLMHNPRRQSASMADWQPQEQRQQMVSAATVHHATASSAAQLLPVPPNQSLPPPGVLSPRNSAMQALQGQGRPSAARSEPGLAYVHHAIPAHDMDISQRATTPTIVGQQLRSITSSAAAAIERARRTTAAAAAGAAPVRRLSAATACGDYRQQPPGIANLGGPGLPPPNTELAREAAERVNSTSPGRQSVSPARAPDRKPGSLVAPPAAAEDGSSSDSGVVDSVLRDMPGYGDRSRSRGRSEQRQLGHTSSADDERSRSAAATAEAMLPAAAAIDGRRSSNQLAPEPSALAAGAVSRRGSAAFAAAQSTEKIAAAEAEAAQQVAAAAAAMHQRPGSPSLAAVRQEAVAASRTAKRASQLAQQAAAEAAEQQVLQQQRMQQGRQSSAALSSRGHGSGSSCSGNASDEEESEQREEDRVWRQMKRQTRHGWFQSPERLRRSQQQYYAALPPGRYISPKRASRWSPWYEGHKQPQQHRHPQETQHKPMRMHFRLPAVLPGVRADAATAAIGLHHPGLQDAAAAPGGSRNKHGGSKGKKGSKQQRHQHGEKLYMQLLRESIEQPLDVSMHMPGSSSLHTAGNSNRSSEDAADYSDDTGTSDERTMYARATAADVAPADAAADADRLAGDVDAETSTGDTEPSLRALQNNNKQQRRARQRMLEQQREREQRRREQRQRRRAATAAALQAAYRAASPERRQSVASGRASPDVVGTAIEAATASAAAAEIAWHAQQQKQHTLQEQQIGPPATSIVRSATSMITSPQLRKEAAEEALHRARLAQLLAGGTRDVPPSTAGTPYKEATRGRRYARASTSQSPMPAATALEGTLGSTAGDDGCKPWQYRSLSAGRQYSGQYNVSPTRLTAAAAGAASLSVGDYSTSAEAVRRSTADAAGHYPYRGSTRRSAELYARPASSLATFNVDPPVSFSTPGIATGVSRHPNQQLQGSLEGSAVRVSAACKSLSEPGWQQQQQQGHQQHDHHHHHQQQHCVQPLAMPMQLTGAAPTVHSVAENLQKLMQRVADTLGTGVAEAAASGPRHLSVPGTQHQNAPVSPSPSPMYSNTMLRPEDTRHWPMEPRNISPTQEPSQTGQLGSGRQSPPLAQQWQLQQPLPLQHGTQQPAELNFELSYADNLRQQGGKAVLMQPSSSSSALQRQQIELVAPLNYVPRHKLIDAAVTGRPASPLWNQMHVAQRRLHDLQQEQQAVLQQLQQQRRSSPSQQQQHDLPGQHVSRSNDFAADVTAQALPAAADRQVLAPAPSPATYGAAGWASVGAAADLSRSRSATGSRNRASLIPVEELVAAMHVLQQANHQQQSPGQQQQQQQLQTPQQQQHQSQEVQARTAMYDGQLPSQHLAFTTVQSPARAAAVQDPNIGSRVPSPKPNQSPSKASAPLSPSNSGAVLGAQSPARTNPSPPEGLEDLRGLLAGVVGSVQGLDSMMSLLLEAARARSPSKWHQSGTAATCNTNIAQGGPGMCQQGQQVQGADEGDTVNLGSVLPPHRYRQLGTGTLSPDQQQQQQAQERQQVLNAVQEQSPILDAAVIQTPGAAVAAAAASVRQVMDQLRSSAMAAWQADDPAAADGGGEAAIASPQQITQQQQQQDHSQLSSMLQPLLPAVQQNSRATHMPSATDAASPDKQAVALATAAAGSAAAAAAAASSPELLHRRQEQGEGGGMGGALTALHQSAALPAELLQQLGALESHLLALQQQMLSQQHHQQQQASGKGLHDSDLQQGHQQQQFPHAQVQQLAEQLTQLQRRLLSHLTGNIVYNSAAAVEGQDGLPTVPLQRRDLAEAPPVQHLHTSLEAVVAQSQTPHSSASVQSPQQRSHATDLLMSPQPAVFPAPSPSKAAAAMPISAVLQSSVSQWAAHVQGASDAAVRKSLKQGFAGVAAASAALQASQAGSIQISEPLSPEPLPQTAASPAAGPRHVSRGVSPISSPARYLPQQQQHQLVGNSPGEQQQQQAALQLELLQASAEAQLVMTQQVNELHEGLGAAAADLLAMQQRLQLLEQHQQQPVQELLLQTHDQQLLLQDLQQQLLQLQQAVGSSPAAAAIQQEWLQRLQEQIQDLQQQQATAAVTIEQQAAAIAEAAGTESQLEPVKEQLRKLEKAQQEWLEGSRVLCETAMRDHGASERVDVLERQLAQQQTAVEALRQQLAELTQQQPQQHVLKPNSVADGQTEDQQQQHLLLQETVAQLKQQLGELQQQWQEQQVQTSAAAAAAAAAAEARAEGPASELVQVLQQQVQQLELKVAQLQLQQQQHTDDDSAAIQQVAALQQQLQVLGTSVEQLQQQQHNAVALAGVTSSDSAAAECSALRQQLHLLDQRVDDMSHHLHECSTAAAITLPLRMAEVEERVAATAQTCADAVKVIALKHASISAMFAEVQASQAAADNLLAQLSKQLNSMKERRGSRSNSRTASGSRSGSAAAGIVI